MKAGLLYHMPHVNSLNVTDGATKMTQTRQVIYRVIRQRICMCAGVSAQP